MEQALLLTTVAGNTGWAHLIPCSSAYLPDIPNYHAAAGGRSFPSAAGFNTSELFFTDDTGVYFLPTRDMHPDAGDPDLAAWLAAHRARVVKLADGRLNIPARPQHMEVHNAWCANVAGSTLIIPVADLALHTLLGLCYLVQSGACLYDDLNGRAIPGLERFAGRVDTSNPFPLSFFEQRCLGDVTVETGTACYAGALMLQALGLGGWTYSGLNPFSLLGASGDPAVPGLGFRYHLLPDGRSPSSPASRVSSRATARRISPTYAPPSRRRSPASSAQAAPLTPRPPAPTAIPPRCAGPDAARPRLCRLRHPNGRLCPHGLRPLPGHRAGDLRDDGSSGPPARH